MKMENEGKMQAIFQEFQQFLSINFKNRYM